MCCFHWTAHHPPSTKSACLTLVEKMKKNYKKETKIQNKLNWQYCHKHNGPRYLSYQTFKWISAKSVSFTRTDDINTAHTAQFNNKTAQFNNKTAQFNNKTAQFNKKYCSILTLLILIKRIIMLIIFILFWLYWSYWPYWFLDFDYLLGSHCLGGRSDIPEVLQLGFLVLHPSVWP